MATKPLVIPHLFSGDKSWDEWIDHFESVADVCNWDDATKLKWLRVRLGGRAGFVFRRLPEEQGQIMARSRPRRGPSSSLSREQRSIKSGCNLV